MNHVRNNTRHNKGHKVNSVYYSVGWFYSKHEKLNLEKIKNIDLNLYEFCKYKKLHENNTTKCNDKYYLVEIKDENFLEKFAILGLYTPLLNNKLTADNVYIYNLLSSYYKGQTLLQLAYNNRVFRFFMDELFIVNDYLYCVDYFNRVSYKRAYQHDNNYFHIYKFKLSNCFKAKILMEKYI